MILLPNDFVRQIGAMSSRDVASLGQLRLLLVRLDSPTGTLASTLEASLRGNEEWSSTAGKTSHTGLLVPESQGRAIPRTGPLHDPAKLRDALKASPHFAVILAKRRRSVSPRITVGRARSMDVVLKHPSVSASHAWLDCDDEGIYFVHDNESTNGTRVNGDQVTPGALVDLAPGDALRFGDVMVIYSLAKTLHEALKSA